MGWFDTTLVPMAILMFAHLLFANKSFCKWRLLHFAMAMTILSMFAISTYDRISSILSGDLLTHYLLYPALLIGVVSAIFVYAVNRHNAISYDTLLKKEIWGVWAKDIGADKH